MCKKRHGNRRFEEPNAGGDEEIHKGPPNHQMQRVKYVKSCQGAHVLSGFLFLIQRSHVVLEVFQSGVDACRDLCSRGHCQGMVDDASEGELAIAVAPVQFVAKTLGIRFEDLGFVTVSELLRAIVLLVGALSVGCRPGRDRTQGKWKGQATQRKEK